MSQYDFKKGKFTEEKVDIDLSDFDSDKFITFDKKSHFTFGNGDGKSEYKKVDNTHIGQLKLFLSELQTLVYYIDTTLTKTILYIGAHPGNHIHILSRLFPSIKFHLYDIGNNWDERLKENQNIIIYNKYFDETDIKKWQQYNQPLFLISDIRSLDVKDDPESFSEREDLVWADMKLQQNWVEKIKPETALLKFKLPYPTEKENKKYYLDGTVLRQFYARPSSAETRLLIKGISYRDWNLNIYEEMNAYHNQIVRKILKFFHPLYGNKMPIYLDRGMNNDYESTGFYTIIMDYLKKINTPVNEANIKQILVYILDNCYPGKKIDIKIEKCI